MRNNKATVQGEISIHVDVDSAKRNATNKVCKILLSGVKGIERERKIQRNGS